MPVLSCPPNEEGVDLYKKASYFAARSAVHRKVRELNRPFNLFKSACFSQSHRVLDATLKAKKAAGLEPAVNHKEALSNSDREKLKDYYSNVLEANDPIKLSMYVWYVLTLHFGLRAREVQLQLKKTDLVFEKENDREFIVLDTDFASKNCQGGYTN